MKRLYFLAPDLACASSTVQDLKINGVEDKNIHILSTNPSAVEAHDMHALNAVKSTDALHMMKQGATAGLLCGLAVILLPGGIVVGAAALLEAGVIGAGLGAATCSLIGLGRSDPSLERYEQEIANGKLLLLVDIPSDEQEHIVGLIKNSHPEAVIDAKALA